MTQDRLHDLLAEVPAHVGVPSPGDAWAAGRRRRGRARAGTVGATVVALAVVGVLVGALLGLLPQASLVQPADGDGGTGVDGYPQRVEKPLLLGDLPDAPGPLAGLLALETGEWLAVSPAGRVWRVDDLLGELDLSPALSDDGTRLGYLTGTHVDASYVVRDLVTGEVRTYPEVGSGVTGRERSIDRYFAAGQTPTSFSPDGRSVLVRGGTFGDSRPTGATVLVLDADDGVREVSYPDDAQVAGWADDDSLVVYRAEGGRASVSVQSLDGAVERTTQLEGVPADTDQWTASVSPDGRRLAVSEETGTGGIRVVTHDLDGGGRSAVGSTGSGVYGCSPSWRDDEPVVPVDPGFDGPGWWRRPATVLRSADVDGSPGQDLTVADPRFRVRCSLWAADALAGDQHRGLAGSLFGTSDLRVWWYWRQVVLAGLLLVVLLVVVVVRRRRTRRTTG